MAISGRQAGKAPVLSRERSDRVHRRRRAARKRLVGPGRRTRASAPAPPQRLRAPTSRFQEPGKESLGYRLTCPLRPRPRPPSPTPSPSSPSSAPPPSARAASALALAETRNGEIVNADALQAYRGFDIGTAKPTEEDRRRVPHHLLDVLDPTERYSAGEFARRARAALADIDARDRLPIVVGGSGLYLQALLDGISPIPHADPEVRAALRRRLADRGATRPRRRPPTPRPRHRRPPAAGRHPARSARPRGGARQRAPAVLLDRQPTLWRSAAFSIPRRIDATAKHPVRSHRRPRSAHGRARMGGGGQRAAAARSGPRPPTRFRPSATGRSPVTWRVSGRLRGRSKRPSERLDVSPSGSGPGSARSRT